MASISGHTAHGPRFATTLRVPRTRGAISGILLVLLGIWGGLVPFLGPRFGYAYTPDSMWTFTWGRFFLEILPAAAAFLGGLGLLTSANRLTGVTSGWLAAVGGGWFVLGPSLSRLWTGAVPGTPTGSTALSVSMQEIGFFYGLGAVIVFLAAMALGRFSVGGNGDAFAGSVRRTGNVDATDANATDPGQAVDRDLP
ncbi:MAG: hypothetical protein J2O49_03185 [Sciscionella sp.]|nr:hypothetical protein [Sciscionella sp.]